MKVSEAKETIKEANFEVGEIEEVNDPNVEKDHVISQDPSPF